MRTLAATELLDLWEQGVNQPPVQRALALLAAACPELTPDELADLSIGRRDARLLALRQQIFGPHLTAVAGCPRCGEQLELSVDAADLRRSTPPASDELTLTAGDDTLRVRLPTSRDLMALAGSGDLATARQILLDRCLLEFRRGEAALPADYLPVELAEQIAARIAEADPFADVQLALTCPVCGHAWQAPFDITVFLWIELDAWAQRMLREVHQLAVAYGWREADILALSPRRRQCYLEQIGA